MAPFPPNKNAESLPATSDPLRRAERLLDALTEYLPERIGPYRILEKLGEGGMGVVYLAEQEKPFHRRVALKFIKLGMDTRQVIARFETEREALALMNHPNVAKVHDAGISETGRPYFVMEHVPGIPITDYCDIHRLSTEERMHLFMDVCHAVQHAHQKGIIHRDIKPSNVLVFVDPSASSEPRGPARRDSPRGAQKPAAQVKVIDFGVAKATQHRLTEKTLFTEQGQLIGTPDYMSPEQAEMSALDIDTRTDIYSLGVLLYELLVGARPFDEKFLRQADLAELQRIIRQVDPPKPSAKLSGLASEPRSPRAGKARPDFPDDDTARDPSRGSAIDTIAHNRRTEPNTLIRQVRGDLDWIVMKCLEKERSRRYETANGLAMEVQRHLNHEPVRAGAPSVVYRLGKFARRNKRAVSAVTTLLMVLAGGAVTSTMLYLSAEMARRDAATALDLLDTMIAAFSDPEKQEHVPLDQVAQEIGEKFANNRLTEARLRRDLGNSYRQLGYSEAGIEQLRLASDLYKQEVGMSDQRTFAADGDLALALKESGRYAAGLELVAETGKAQQRVLGDSHPNLLETMNREGNIQLSLGNYVAAEELHQKVLDERKRTKSKEHRATLESMTNLGLALEYLGRYEEAEHLHRDAMEIFKSSGKTDQQFYQKMANNLANSIHFQGRYAEAEQRHREIYETRSRTARKGHKSAFGSLANLAEALAKQGRLIDAETFHRESLVGRYQELGPKDSDTFDSMRKLALVLAQRGKYGEAEDLFRGFLDLWRQCQLDEKHPAMLGTTWEMAALLFKQGKTEKSEEWYRKALGLYSARCKTAAVTAVDLDGLASLLMTCQPTWLRDPQRALEAAERAVKMTNEKNFAMLATRAKAYRMTGQVERAIQSQRLALERLPAEGSPDRAEIESMLGECLASSKKFAEGEPRLLGGYQWMKEHWEGDPSHVAEFASRLVTFYQAWEAAEPGNGHAEKAAEWRGKLEETSTSQNTETSNGPNVETSSP